MDREQLASVVDAIERGDLDAVEYWAGKIDEGDYPVFIEKYQQTLDWKQKDAVAFLLSYQDDLSLEPIFLNYSLPHFACYTTKGYTPCSIAQSAIAKCECIRALLYLQKVPIDAQGEN